MPQSVTSQFALTRTGAAGGHTGGGAHFIIRLKAALKDFSDSYPGARPISATESRECVSLAVAKVIRQRVR